MSALDPVDARLIAHEAVCAERWSHITRALDRLDRHVIALHERWWWLLVTVAGAGLGASAALVWARLP